MLPRFRENRWAELAEIYTTRSLGCFLLLISFLARSVTFDLLFQGQIHENGARILLTRFRENRWAELAEIYTMRSLGVFSVAD